MAATEQSQADKLKVFISYSRADSRFADELVAGLDYDGGFDITIDRHSIEKGEDWQARLGALIEAADTIVFVLSPASATSDICRWEVEHAAELNKRVLPVLHQPLAGVAAPPALGKINYIDFTVSPTLISGIRDLAKVLRTDLGWLREATRLLNLALDWDRAGRRDNRLLSGPDIVDAKRWLAACPTSEKPTELHRDYIRASEAAEVTRLDAEHTRLAELAIAQAAVANQARRLAARTFAGLAVALVLAVAAAGASWFAWGQAERARQSEQAAGETTREAQVTQSGLLSEAARVISDEPGGGDAPLAMLLALESMPDSESDDALQAGRPSVVKALAQLDRAFRNNRDLARIAHDREVMEVAWTPDGTRLTTVSRDRTAQIFAAASGAELARISNKDNKFVTIAWSLDGARLATASSDSIVRIVDAASGRELARIAANCFANAVAWSTDGTRLATACSDMTIKIFEAASGTELGRIAHNAEVIALAFSRDGTRLATASEEKIARIFEAASGNELGRIAHDGNVTALAWNPDGTRLATASSDKTARIVDAASGRELARITHGFDVFAVAWSPDGTRLATAARDSTARIVDAASGRQLALISHESTVFAVAWSPDGTRLATASADKTARIADAASGIELARIGHGQYVSSVAWSPDGKRLATASWDKTVRIVEPTSGIELVTRLVQDTTVKRVALSPDGSRFVTVSENWTVRIVETASGTELARIAHDGEVTAVNWSPDGTRLATTSLRNKPRIFEAKSGIELPRIAHDGEVSATTWSPDGKQFTICSEIHRSGERDRVGPDCDKERHKRSRFESGRHTPSYYVLGLDFAYRRAGERARTDPDGPRKRRRRNSVES